MAVVRERVKQGFKPTREIIKVNPTVKKFTTGQEINVPSKPQAGMAGKKFDQPAVGLTGSFLTGAGVANQGTAAPTRNIATEFAQELQREMLRFNPVQPNQLTMRSRGTNYNNGNIVTPMYANSGGSSVLDNYAYNVASGLTNPPTYGGWGGDGGGGGGGYGGGGWYGGGGGGGGGGGNYVDYTQPVQPVGIGNDINTALNWRVG